MQPIQPALPWRKHWVEFTLHSKRVRVCRHGRYRMYVYVYATRTRSVYLNTRLTIFCSAQFLPGRYNH